VAAEHMFEMITTGTDRKWLVWERRRSFQSR